MNGKREKLYKLMQENIEENEDKNYDKLFLQMTTLKREAVMEFNYYSEFLNIFNTLIFFYVRIELNQNNKLFKLSF